MSRKKVTVERLREVVTYHPESGVFTDNNSGAPVGSANSEGYLYIRIDALQYSAHRLAYLWVMGKHAGLTIDHIDGDRANNRWENLREVTGRTNARNKRRSSRNKTGITGVCWKGRTGNWEAYISSRDGRRNLGSFHDFFEACCARKSAEIRNGYHPNHGIAPLTESRCGHCKQQRGSEAKIARMEKMALEYSSNSAVLELALKAAANDYMGAIGATSWTDEAVTRMADRWIAKAGKRRAK